MASAKTSFVLFESASGYGIFELIALDEIGTGLESVQKSMKDLERMSKVCKKIVYYSVGECHILDIGLDIPSSDILLTC